MNRTDARLTGDDLNGYFHSAVVSREENRIGVEYEIFCLEAESRRRLGFAGVPGIEWLLGRLLETGGGSPVKEAGRTVGIEHPDYSVSIEPGGQLEASFPPCRSAAEFSVKLEKYLSRLREAGGGKVIFIASGADPVTPFAEVPWVPKRRYRIMRRYWDGRPGLSHHMMTQTAAVQVSIDYNSEADAVGKLANAVSLSQILTGLFANSPVYGGIYRYTGSFRKNIWCRTDRERSGIPAGCGGRIGSFADYVDYALSVPMLFILRDGRLEELEERFTFRDFLDRGWRGGFPGLEDWRRHLNTIFSLVRFNNSTLEVRVFDSNRPELVAAIAALVRGIFYSGGEFGTLAGPAELAALARENLDREDRRFLDPVDRMIREGTSPADSALRAFRDGGPESLLESLRI